MYKDLIINFLNLFLDVYLFLILARVILSFIPSAIGGFRLFVYNATEPLLAPIRKVVPPLGGAIDLSPIIFYFAIEIIIERVSRFL
jgi:YggT family protein